jgi:F5/8 type C domain
MKRYIVTILCISCFLTSYSAFADQKLSINPALVTANSTYKNEVPSNVVDGNIQTLWNSGKFPTQWIQFDLGEFKGISRVRLTVSQTPAGSTTHKVYMGNSTSTLELANSFTSYTSDGMTIEIPVQQGGRYLRIETSKSPSWVSWREIEIYETKNWVSYYGYYCSACFWVGNGNYIETVANHSNVVHLTANDPDFDRKFQQAANLNLKVFVDVSSVFFIGKNARPDLVASWNSFADRISDRTTQIAAFYIADEPNRQGFARSALSTAVSQAKNRFPIIPTASIFSGTEGNLNNVDLFDWVGIDCYDHGSGGCRMIVSPPSRGGAAGIPLYEKLRSRLDVSRQRIILVPQAGIDTRKVSNSAVNDKLPAQADQHLQKALEDPLVVAVVPFIWQSFDDGTNAWYGAEQFPSLVEKYTSFGRRITGK